MINNYLKSRISWLYQNTLDKGNLIPQHEQIEEMTRVTKIREVLGGNKLESILCSLQLLQKKFQNILRNTVFHISILRLVKGEENQLLGERRVGM